MFRRWLQYFAARSGELIEDLFDMLMNFQIFDTKWSKVQSIRIVTPTLASYLGSQNWQSFSGNLSSIQKYYQLVLHQEKRTTLTFRVKPVILTCAHSQQQNRLEYLFYAQRKLFIRDLTTTKLSVLLSPWYSCGSITASTIFMDNLILQL